MRLITRALFINIILFFSTILHLANGRHSQVLTTSDIVKDEAGGSTKLGLVNLKATTVTCVPIYGFLPCATTFWGLLFMIVVYEVLLSYGGQYISAGSDLFFETFGTGLFGASIFQLLGTIPQVGLILGYGVTFDVETSKTARIMLISLIPFLILQLAKIINSPSGIHVVVLVSLIVTIGLLLVYFIYQIFQPWIQNRRLEFVLRKYIKRNLLQNLLTAGRRPNIPVIREIFHRIDQNGNSYISNSELRALIVGIQIEESGLRQDYLVARVMEQFDSSQDHQINEQEFVTGLSNWLMVARDSVSHTDHGIFRRNSAKTTTEEQQSLIAKNVATQSAANDRRKDWLNYVKAGLLVILGTAITLTLGQPLVGTLVRFSFAANVPSFLISYVVIPLALNFGQAVRAISSAREKTEKAISLMLSEIYNRIFMNNLMGLVGFLALVYIRNVSWDVSAEVLVVLIICTLMGLYTSFSTKFPVWTSIVAFLLYPISLLSLYLLTSVLGWS